MLQVHEIREHLEAYTKALAKRGLAAKTDLQDILEIDEKRRSTQASLDETLAQSNTFSKEIGMLFKNGETQKANLLKEKTTQLKERSKTLNETLNETVTLLESKLYNLPNIPHESVPAGTDENDNEEVFREGDIPTLEDTALPHWELAKKYDLIDFELGVKVTGAGFPVYKGKGARLQRALITYFLDKNTEAGYTEYQVPHLVNEASGFGTGQLPDKEGQMYHVTADDLYLIPTAEVPVTNIHADEILDEDSLPINYTASSACFRREAGSYGKETRGLLRVHQFNKVEMVKFVRPEKSYDELEQLLANAEAILQSFGLHYRVLELCTGDLSFSAAKCFDLEIWSPAEKQWLEVSSCSNFEDFQARRGNIRYRRFNDNKTDYVHTLNGSGVATPRLMIALLESYQTPDGKVIIPKCLQPYMETEVLG
mgnify:CR=1 FL=1